MPQDKIYVCQYLTDEGFWRKEPASSYTFNLEVAKAELGNCKKVWGMYKWRIVIYKIIKPKDDDN
jgi:hypothetical protein